MERSDRIDVMLATIGLLVACGPTASGLGTEGLASGVPMSEGDDATGLSSAAETSVSGSGSTSGVSGATTTFGSTDPSTNESGESTGSGSENCCEAHSAPACNEPAVVECVCAIQTSCCAFGWNADCAAIAQDQCNATCGDTTGDSSGPGPTTGGANERCTDIETFELMPFEATLTGAWSLGKSMFGEGMVVIFESAGDPDGSILFEPNIPCADTWYIWVRAFDSPVMGDNDSYFAALDGQPLPMAIFEGDCTEEGVGYRWVPLNWRVPGTPMCEYLENPWAPQWGTGPHQIEFQYREATAMGRLMLTNDPTFIPR